MSLPRVCLVTPALADANNGNWHTASRWQRFLAGRADVRLVQHWDGEPADALVALHARRSAQSIARWAATGRPLALVLTGTDLYRDLEAGDAQALHSLQCASHVVVLQERALRRLDAPVRAKTRVIVQSAARVTVRRRAGSDAFVDDPGASVANDQGAFVANDRGAFIAVGHLRAEKDPLTLMRAACRLAPPLVLHHIGGALDAALGDAAREATARCAAYRWLGALPAGTTRRHIAAARALVHASVMEGGAHVVIEAVRSGVPVLASRIDGNLGLLGDDYEGCFDVGDDAALAALMRRFAEDAAFAARLAAQCAAREPLMRPQAERAAVRTLLDDMLRRDGDNARHG